MNSDLLIVARQYLVTYLAGKHNGFESRHPWRMGWEFVVLHSLQVEAYVQKILARQAHSLSEGDVLRLRLAAILHDIGRLEQRENHAQRGATLVADWLQARPEVREQIEGVEELLGMIASHSQKGVPETDLGRAILKDADLLDEIGAISVFMAANWIERGSPFFFHQLRQRLEQVELPFCERQLARLNTPGGWAILNEKKAFILAFIAQLDGELAGDAEALRCLAEQSLQQGKGRVRLRSDLQDGDAEAITRLHGTLYATEYGLDCTFQKYVADGLAEFVQSYEPRKDRLWVAEMDGQLAGCIAIRGRADSQAQLRWFLVHPACRGMGLGRTLLDEAIQFSRQARYRSIFLWTLGNLHAALHLYQSAGFHKTEEKTHEIWGQTLTEEKYEMLLDA